MTRRGFLAALFGGAAAAIAAVDPDLLRWQPRRKLISIPAPAEWRQFRSVFEIPDSGLRLSLAEFEEQYIAPAMQTVAECMDRHFLLGSNAVSGRRHVWSALELPRGVERAGHRKLPNGVGGRCVVSYDIYLGFLGRVDALVRG